MHLAGWYGHPVYRPKRLSVAVAVLEGTFWSGDRTVPFSLPEIREPAARSRLGTRPFRLFFAVAATLIGVYVTLLSGEIFSWRAAAVCWALTLIVIALITRLASMVERCEREAREHGGAWSLPVEVGHGNEPARFSAAARQRVTHLERVVMRQHRFVSDAAHELRTPLTAQTLVGENVLARQTASRAELNEAVVSMLEESKHMKRLIEGLLDLTRASLTGTSDTGITRQAVALDLSSLARDCVESLRVLAEEKNQIIETNVAAAVWVDADMTMVRQALLNVIHNSIEHCPDGTRIRVEVAPRMPGEGLVRVQDNGPGIPMLDQRRVFERFYRGSGASRQRSLGLGLSIAKAILCSQGGGIELNSRPGEGCCFILSLPLPEARLAVGDQRTGDDLNRRAGHRRSRDRSRWAVLRLDRRWR
jgi:signal transduction histidine kinase